MASAHIELMNALSSLYLGAKYSDLAIRCKSRQWSVHRAIVCSRSGFFDGACGSQFREANTGVVDLSEDDEDAVDHMIHYFYHLDYLTPDTQKAASELFGHRQAAQERRRAAPKKMDLSAIVDPLFAQATAQAPSSLPTPAASPPPPPLAAVSSPRIDSAGYFDAQSKTRTRGASPHCSASSSGCDSESDNQDDSEYETDDSGLLVHTRVYALAEKYDIPALKEVARSKFEVAMACFYDSPEFADAIEEVYCTSIDSDRGLRDIVLQAFRSHPQLASTRDVFRAIKETPSLAFELWKVERGVPV